MSQKVSLTTEETYILADLMQEITDKRLNRRLLSISLRHFGYKIQEIGLILGVSERTISTWISLFLAGGFEELLSLKYQKVRSSRINPYRPLLTSYMSEHPQATVKDLQTQLQKAGLEVEYSWLYRWLTLHRSELESSLPSDG